VKATRCGTISNADFAPSPEAGKTADDQKLGGDDIEENEGVQLAY
jgi:hypothetical protein